MSGLFDRRAFAVHIFKSCMVLWYSIHCSAQLKVMFVDESSN